MKIAISIHDDVFQEAEQYARRAKKSRSKLYGEALAEYLARHAPDAITEAMNKVCEDVNQAPDPFVTRAGRRTLEQTEW